MPNFCIIAVVLKPENDDLRAFHKRFVTEEIGIFDGSYFPTSRIEFRINISGRNQRILQLN